jgi:hypothetical protein
MISILKRRGMPERIKRHIALRELAEDHAIESGEKLSCSAADKRARQLAGEPMPHTRHFWERVIKPDYQ